MEDSDIIALFRAHDEKAIKEAERKYGRGCYQIAFGLLGSREDAEETVNEMWLKVWQAFTEKQPDNLFAFLSAATRNLALNRISAQNTAKRGNGAATVPLEYADRTTPSRETVDSTLDSRMLTEAIEHFLDALPEFQCAIFVERYTNGLSPAEIAEEFGISGGKVRITLLRVRRKLEDYLKKEGYL